MNREPYDITALHPKMRGPIFALTEAIGKLRYPSQSSGFHIRLYPFEGYRHPLRQNYLRTVTKTTKAGPWQSAHQYGLAVDFAGRLVEDDTGLLVNSWTWELRDEAWSDLKRYARSEGLDVPIAWDRGHVVHPLFDKMMGIK